MGYQAFTKGSFKLYVTHKMTFLTHLFMSNFVCTHVYTYTHINKPC